MRGLADARRGDRADLWGIGQDIGRRRKKEGEAKRSGIVMIFHEGMEGWG